MAASMPRTTSKNTAMKDVKNPAQQAGTEVLPGNERSKGRPLTQAEIDIGKPYKIDEMHSVIGSIAGHLPIIHALARGCGGGMMVDIGIGSTTRTLLMVAHEMNARLYSCDYDRRRYAPLTQIYPPTKRWRLSLTSSANFIDQLPTGLNFVSHDGAHDEETVRDDLLRLIPKMKRFGIITIHDTQHITLGTGMMRAINDVVARTGVSTLTLPFHNGLTILRVEVSENPAIQPTSFVKRGERTTAPFNVLTSARGG